MAAAKEFNIGKDTLVDFLVSKGFNSDDLKPTSKLTEPMYRILQSEFQQDKVAKEKAEKVELVKCTLQQFMQNWLFSSNYWLPKLYFKFDDNQQN